MLKFFRIYIQFTFYIIIFITSLISLMMANKAVYDNGGYSESYVFSTNLLFGIIIITFISKIIFYIYDMVKSQQTKHL